MLGVGKVSMLYEQLVLRPLRRLYLQGPSFVGFWGGQALADVCAQMSTVPASFWAEHPDRCDVLVEQRLQSFVVTVETVAYAWAAYRAVSAYFWRWAVVHPIVTELRLLRAGAPENLRLEGKDGRAQG